MKGPAIGCTTSGCQVKAELAAASWPSRQAKVDWALSPRRSTAPETASKASSWRNFCRSGWEWICSSRNPVAEYLAAEIIGQIFASDAALANSEIAGRTTCAPNLRQAQPLAAAKGS